MTLKVSNCHVEILSSSSLLEYIFFELALRSNFLNGKFSHNFSQKQTSKAHNPLHPEKFLHCIQKSLILRDVAFIDLLTPPNPNLEAINLFESEGVPS